mgnify:CR=1 FL=1
MTTQDRLRRRLRVLDTYTVRSIRRREEALIRALALSYGLAARDLDMLAVGAFNQFGAPATWSITDYQASQRTAWLLDQIVSRTDQLNGYVTGVTQTELLRSYQDGYYLRGWTLSQVLPRGLALTLPILPEQAILAALSFPYEGSTFFERMGDAREDFIRKLRKTITVSQIEGDGIYNVQKRLSSELGWPISRRTKVLAKANKGNFARTEMIARTEMLRASNLGAQAVDETNRDIVKAWEWLTARDDRVCPICAPLDGRTWPLGQGERPPRHPRCRCTSIPVRKTDAELGLPEIESAFPPREMYKVWARRTGHPVPE